MNKILRLASIILIVGLVFSIAAPITVINTKASDNTWPWGNAQEPYPWLDYLVQLWKQSGDTGPVKLLIITRHDIAIQQKTKELFLNSPVAKKLNIVGLNFVQVGPTLFEYYMSKAPIDVAWGGGPTLFDYLYNDGYLAPISPDNNKAAYAALYEASKFPDTIHGIPLKRFGSDGKIYWIAAALSSFGFTVNHDKLKEWNLPTPSTWVDLSNPIFATTPQLSVGGADPTKSTSNTRIYEIMLQVYGWDLGWMILTGFAGNSKIYDASDAVREGVIQGEIAVGVTIDFYGYIAMQINPHTEYIMPQKQTAINGDPIALSKKTRHPIQALAFIAWVLSEYGGQQVWLDKDINRLPINPAVFKVAPPDLKRPDLQQSYENALGNIGFIFNDTRAASWEFVMQQYFSAALVGNAHQDLQTTWSEIANAWINHKISDEWMAYYSWKLLSPLSFKDPATGKNVTFSEKYAASMNNKMRSDATLLNQLKLEWENAMINRADSLLKQFESTDHSKPAPQVPCIAYQLVNMWKKFLNETPMNLPADCQTTSTQSSSTTQTTTTSTTTTTPPVQTSTTTQTSTSSSTSTAPKKSNAALLWTTVIIIIIIIIAAAWWAMKK
ncbi:MAG: ABC transporter substrate-binding protein [Desulfurococcales archaeon]|nr:ABC transporter substrate-binding protein [Desulfurococcales archaeon]